MSKLIRKQKPNIYTAIIPIAIRNFLIVLLLTSIPLLTLYFIQSLLVIKLTILKIVLLTIIFSLIVTIISIITDLIKLVNTEYRFHQDYLERYYQFIVHNSRSISYKHIIEIKVKQNMWERFLGTGTLVLATGNDNTPDLHLSHINDLENTQKFLRNLINKQQHIKSE